VIPCSRIDAGLFLCGELKLRASRVCAQALYHGVPQLCLTVWGDQPYNAARMQYRGYGRDLGRMRAVSAARLAAGARDVIGGAGSCAAAARAAATVFRSRPLDPRQRAAWWLEHVLRHGGAHLHSRALDLPWYQYLMIDLLAVLVVAPVVVMTSAVSAACTWWCCVRRRSTAHHKQQ